ncbi:MAG TPA: L,D-transpeptidase [Burkholderiales bacterium]|nr:L,D-transpeptidase [Burkholderiales bacterium]
MIQKFALRHGARVRAMALPQLATAILAGDVSAMGSHPARLSRVLHMPETMLVEALIDIRNNRLGAALERVDALLAVKPDFRLAQLVRGDLLMARARPIPTLGAADAPADRLNDLRDEARARLTRYTLQPPKDRVPKYLLRLQPEQRYAVVVDTASSTLYLFENRDGTPRYLTDYYITVGKNGTNKLREGDKKTPLGVYHVTSELPRAKLDAFYGSGAFPLSYPNEWDARQGRNGHGIWLHGTPRDTYSRPPRASDGCVVLANEDLDELAKRVQIGLTPVIIADHVDWIDASMAQALRAGLSERLERWRADWEGRNTERYLQYYARSFAAENMNLAGWSAQKRRVNGAKEWIKVRLSAVSMFLYPGRDDLAVISFFQDYSSSNLSNKMRKRQYWIREGGIWKILYEGAG